MGTFIPQDNWLLRRIGAAIFGWGTTITTPVSAPSVISVTHSREYFHDWPDDWCLKIEDGCGGNFGKLRLEVKQTEVSYANTEEMYVTTAGYYDPLLFGPQDFPGGLYSYVRWNGDNQQYDGYTIRTYSSVLLDPAIPLYGWDSYTATFTFPNGYSAGSVVVDSGTQSTPYSPPAPYILSNFNGSYPSTIEEAVDMTGATILTPQDVLDGWGTSATTTNYYYNHKPGASHWNKSATVAKTNLTFSAIWGITYDVINTNGITFIWDESWPACGYIQKITTDLRWKYDPQSTKGCIWWQGYQASVKVTYKRATVSRANGPDGVFLTIGSFSAAGDNTQTITLHDQYTEEYVSSTITMPSAEGYVYAIDDIEVLSVTKP
jgi:hypothetical protein